MKARIHFEIEIDSVHNNLSIEELRKAVIDTKFTYEENDPSIEFIGATLERDDGTEIETIL